MTTDELLHLAGQALIMAVGVAAELASPGTWLIWIFAGTSLVWPLRELMQMRAAGPGRRWTAHKLREGFLPVGLALVIALAWTAVEVLLLPRGAWML